MVANCANARNSSPRTDLQPKDDGVDAQHGSPVVPAQWVPHFARVHVKIGMPNSARKDGPTACEREKRMARRGSRGRADRVIDVTIGAWKGYVGGMSIMKGKWPPAYGPSVIETVTFTLSTLLWPSGNSIVVDACSLLLREKLSSAISRCTRIDARFVASLERPPSILSQHPRPRATAPKGPLASLPHGLLRPLLCPLTIHPLP